MSRFTLIFSVVAELVLAAPAWAAPNRYERCLDSCDDLHEQAEKMCKKNGKGVCSARAKAPVDAFLKQCKESCAKRKKK